MKKETEQKLKELELTKEIAHTIIHRMTLRQLLFKGGFWRKQYDAACEKISQLELRC